MAKTERSAKDEALHWLEYRDRTEGELRKHLREKGFDAEEIRESLAFVKEYGYINDDEYCRKYIEYSWSRGRGSLRIRKELEDKGVDPALIGIALEEYYDGDRERETALREAEKEISRLEGARPEKRDWDRIARKLASRGFPASIVWKVLEQVRRKPDWSDELD